MHDYYEILQVSPKAELEVIQVAYKRLALKYHPDRNREPQALEQMKLLNEAIAVLSDPERRQEYDCVRAAGPEMRQKFVADAIAFGDDALARQEFVSAIRSYSQALDYEPGLAKAYHNRGIAHAGTGNFAQAVADISEAIRLAPLDPIAYRNRARAYQALGDIDRAKADLDQANRLTPVNATAGPRSEECPPSPVEQSGQVSLVPVSVAVATVTFATAWIVVAMHQPSFVDVLRVCLAPWAGFFIGGLLGGVATPLVELVRYFASRPVKDRAALAIAGTLTAVAVGCLVGFTGFSAAAVVAAVVAGIAASFVICSSTLCARFARVVAENSSPTPDDRGDAAAPEGGSPPSFFDQPFAAWCRVGTVVGFTPFAIWGAYLQVLNPLSTAPLAAILLGTLGAALGASTGFSVALLFWQLAHGIRLKIVGVDRMANRYGLNYLRPALRWGTALGLLLAVASFLGGKASSAAQVVEVCAGTAVLAVGLGYLTGYLGGIVVWGRRIAAGSGYGKSIVAIQRASRPSLLVLDFLILMTFFCVYPLVAGIPDLESTATKPTNTPSALTSLRESSGDPALGLTVDGELKVVAITSVIGGDNRAFSLGDRIIAVANVPVDSLNELEDVVNRSRPGDTLRMRVVRRGVSLELAIVLGRRAVP